MARFDRPVLVTGAAGCIGAWVIARLLAEGSPVVAFDLSGERRRLGLLVEEAEAARMPWHQGDIGDPEALEAVVAEHGVGTIPFGGRIQFEYAGDVSEIILRCAAADVAGAEVFNIGGPAVAVEEIVGAIARVVDGAEIGCEGDPLPFPSDGDAAPLAGFIGALPETPLEDGVARTVAAFRDLLARGLVSPEA